MSDYDRTWPQMPTTPPYGPPPQPARPLMPPPPAPPAGGWAPPPQPPKAPAGKRILAAIAALALVMMSAGVGAALALALHKDGETTRFASPTVPVTPSNPLIPGGSSNGSGSGSTNSGSLNADEIANKVIPGMVNIFTEVGQGGRAAGSGMVISSTGAILTNNHVIADSTEVSVTIGGTGSTYKATVVGYSVQDDVALLQINESVTGLKTVTLGDADTVNVGDPVVTIGNALGKGGKPSVKQGAVTALHQQVTAGDPGGRSETLTDMIQMDAPIQPGDSGGALINADGEVVGVNTAAAGSRFRISTGTNVGFAIRINHALDVVKQIQSGDETERVHIGPRALLGVNVSDLSNAGNITSAPTQIAPVDEGALVIGVQDGTGASDIGLESGDVITSVEGKTIVDSGDLHLALTTYHPGDKVDVEWTDTNGDQHQEEVKLVEGPPA